MVRIVVIILLIYLGSVFKSLPIDLQAEVEKAYQQEKKAVVNKNEKKSIKRKPQTQKKKQTKFAKPESVVYDPKILEELPQEIQQELLDTNISKMEERNKKLQEINKNNMELRNEPPISIIFAPESSYLEITGVLPKWMQANPIPEKVHLEIFAQYLIDCVELKNLEAAQQILLSFRRYESVY